jgi:hypothetical protein
MRVTPAATLGALTGASGLGVTRTNDQTHRAPRTMEGKPMTDNAALADLIERLSAIEERAKEVLREREDSTAAYILEGGTRHVGKPDARK